MTNQLKQPLRQPIITKEWIASWHINWHLPSDSQDGPIRQIIEDNNFTMIIECKEKKFTHINSGNLIVNVIDIQTHQDNTIIITVQPSNQSKADHTMYVSSGKAKEAIHAVEITKKSFLNFCRISQNQN